MSEHLEKAIKDLLELKERKLHEVSEIDSAVETMRRLIDTKPHIDCEVSKPKSKKVYQKKNSENFVPSTRLSSSQAAIVTFKKEYE